MVFWGWWDLGEGGGGREGGVIEVKTKRMFIFLFLKVKRGRKRCVNKMAFFVVILLTRKKGGKKRLGEVNIIKKKKILPEHLTGKAPILLRGGYG